MIYFFAAASSAICLALAARRAAASASSLAFLAFFSSLVSGLSAAPSYAFQFPVSVPPWPLTPEPLVDRGGKTIEPVSP